MVWLEDAADLAALLSLVILLRCKKQLDFDWKVDPEDPLASRIFVGMEQVF